MRKHYHFVCAMLLVSSSVSSQCVLTQADLLAAPAGAFTIAAGQELCITSDFCMGAVSNFPGSCANSNITAIIVNGALRIAPNVTFRFAGSIGGSGDVEIMEGAMIKLFGSVDCTNIALEVVDAGITSGTSTKAIPSCSNSACEITYPGGYVPFGIVSAGLGYTTTGCNLTGFPNSSVMLPVTFSKFTGYVTGTDIRLNWTTASEQQNKGFEVQRINASGVWEKAGWVPSKAADGNSVTNLDYSFTDNQPTGKQQYRLKQIDYDNHFAYSSVIRIEALRSNEWRAGAEGNTIRIQVQSASQENAIINVISAGGNILYKGSHQLNPGSNMILIPAGNFAKGLQVVTLQKKNGEVKREKILLR